MPYVASFTNNCHIAQAHFHMHAHARPIQVSLQTDGCSQLPRVFQIQEFKNSKIQPMVLYATRHLHMHDSKDIWISTNFADANVKTLNAQAVLINNCSE